MLVPTIYTHPTATLRLAIAGLHGDTRASSDSYISPGHLHMPISVSPFGVAVATLASRRGRSGNYWTSGDQVAVAVIEVA